MLLNCHSYYSLKYGTIPIKELLDQLILNGYEAAVLTDINNTSASLEFIKESQAKHFHALAGVEFRNGDEMQYIAIARNNAGFQEINEYLTAHNLSKQPYPAIAPSFNNTYIIYPFGKQGAHVLRDNEYIGIRATQLNKLYGQPKSLIDRLVMLCPVTFLQGTDLELHRQLRAVHHNTLLSKLRAEQQAAPDEVLQPAAQLIGMYKTYPRIINNTFSLLERCRFDMDFDL